MRAKTAISILMILLLFGCATVRVNEQSQFSEKVGRIPNIGEKASAPVGGVIYQQYRYISKTGYRLSDSLNVRFKLGKIIVSAGDFLSKADIDGKTVFCTEKLGYYDPLQGQLRSCVLSIQSKMELSTMLPQPPGRSGSKMKLQLKSGTRNRSSSLPSQIPSSTS